MTVPQVESAALGQAVSALGFGCASLGSRVAPTPGLAALERAFAQGVTWFDVAPSYGDGQAEALLGRFLAGKRDRVQVLTKVGIAPPHPSLKQRLMRPAMRMTLAAVPSLRAAVRRRRPAAIKLPLDGALVLASVEASLRRLGTDHVDVLALHDATAEDVARDDVIAALETVVRSGKARAAGIASSPEAAAEGVAAWDGYRIVQFAENPQARGGTRFAAACPQDARPIDRVTHSMFGTEGALADLAARIDTQSDVKAAFARAGYEGPSARQAADFLADYAFTANPGGVVIVSMFDARHLAANMAARDRAPDPAAVRALAATIARETASVPGAG